MDPKMLRPEDVEKLYCVPVGTLAQWRYRKIGPDYFKMGQSVYYRLDELEKYFESKRVRCHRQGER